MNEPNRKWTSGIDTQELLEHLADRDDYRRRNCQAWLLSLLIIVILVLGTAAIVYVLLVAR